MSVGAIVQARMGSTRLPGKALLDIEGRSMLARVLDRTRAARLVDRVVVATTDNPRDDAVAAHAGTLGVDVFRGDEDDVLDRYYQAARHYQFDVVVRITSDCPLLDPAVIDDVIRPVLEPTSRIDYSANGLRRTFPRGLDAEAAPVATLERAWREATSAHERAHVFPYVYDHPDRFRLNSVTAETDWSHLRWTVDTEEDLSFVRAVYRSLGSAAFTWRDVLALLERSPELLQINATVRQKAAREI